jgi:hypothetical protein
MDWVDLGRDENTDRTSIPVSNTFVHYSRNGHELRRTKSLPTLLTSVAPKKLFMQKEGVILLKKMCDLKKDTDELRKQMDEKYPGGESRRRLFKQLEEKTKDTASKQDTQQMKLRADQLERMVLILAFLIALLILAGACFFALTTLHLASKSDVAAAMHGTVSNEDFEALTREIYRRIATQNSTRPFIDDTELMEYSVANYRGVIIAIFCIVFISTLQYWSTRENMGYVQAIEDICFRLAFLSRLVAAALAAAIRDQPSAFFVILYAGRDCELNGFYFYNGNFHRKDWWVKSWKPYDLHKGVHPQQFQIWFNEGQWRVGYYKNHWWVNNDYEDWRTAKWTPKHHQNQSPRSLMVIAVGPVMIAWMCVVIALGWLIY